MKALMKLTLILILLIGCYSMKAQSNAIPDTLEYKYIVISNPTFQGGIYFWIDIEDNEDGTRIVCNDLKGRGVPHYSSKMQALRTFTSKGWRVHTCEFSSTGLMMVLLERKKNQVKIANNETK